MDMSLDEYRQTNTFEPIGVMECIEHWNDDSNVKNGSPKVEAGGIDACNFTSMVTHDACSFTVPMLGTPDVPIFPTAVGNSTSIHEEERKGCVVTNDNGFLIPCKSAFPLAVSEADLSKFQASTTENGASVEYNDKDKNVQDDDGNFTACKSTPLLNVYDTEESKCLGLVEGNISGVENHSGASDKATNDSGFPVSCKSACPLTVSEADLLQDQTSTEGNGASVESNDDVVEKSAQVDGNFTTCMITPLVNEANDSKCLESTEGKVSAVENDRGASDKAAKNSKSRERKKSKYLCYPFVNHYPRDSASLWGSDMDEVKSPENISIKDDSTSSLVKSSKKRREPRKVLTDYAKLEKITVASAELLKQLCMVAVDHLNPHYNRAIDPAELFFNGFRATVFRGLSGSEGMGEDEQVGGDKGDAHVGKTRKEKGKKGSDKTPLSGLSNVNVNFSPVDSQMDSTPASDNMKPQRKRKRKEATTSAPVDPNQAVGEPGKKKRPRKKGTAPDIPSINGNNVKPISLEVCLQDAGPYAVADSTSLNADVAIDATNPKVPALAPVFQTPEKVKTTAGLSTPDKSNSELSLDQMKQSLELMTSMLEKSSTTVSPDTRGKLENEIKNLLKKVNPMVNPSF